MSSNANKPSLAQRAIRWMARRVPPTREPGFPFIFGAVCEISAWFVIPMLVRLIESNPFSHKALDGLGLIGALQVVGYFLTGAGTVIGLMLWARGIQLCWPDHFNAHDDRHT